MTSKLFKGWLVLVQAITRHEQARVIIQKLATANLLFLLESSAEILVLWKVI